MKISLSDNFLVAGSSFFADFSKDNLLRITDYASVLSFKKSKNIFFSEDESKKFYIVAEGAVKITIIDEDGNEAILQIVEAGGFLNDIFSDQFQFDAKALNDCTIISFQMKEVRELLHEIPQFGLAVLKEIANRNKVLMSRLASLRLSDSKQKVGQFLLEMAFSDSDKKSPMIDLKYEKSVIASYLGINPETLSRTLQKLKDAGEISVDRNKVTLLKSDSLCDYCTSEIAGKCVMHKADFCKY